MNITEIISRYGASAVEIILDNAEHEVFKRLLKVTKEYAENEAAHSDDQPNVRRAAIYSLEDVQMGFDHYDVYRDKPLMIPGDAAVFLTRGKHMATMPNMEFMRTTAVKLLIIRLRDALGLPYGTIVDGH